MLEKFSNYALLGLFLTACVPSSAQGGGEVNGTNNIGLSLVPLDASVPSESRVRVSAQITNETSRDLCFWTIDGGTLFASEILSKSGKRLVSLKETVAVPHTSKKNRISKNTTLVVRDVFVEPVDSAYVDSNQRIVQQYRNSDTLIYRLSIAVSDCSLNRVSTWDEIDFVESNGTLRVSY